MTVTTKAALAARLAMISAISLSERLRKPVAQDLSDVPRSPDSITPEWLTQALLRGHPSARVTSISLGERSDGTTSRQVLHVEYNVAARELRLPERIFCKSSEALLSRIAAGLSGALASEAGFYSVLRPEVEMETPRCYHAAVDPRSFRSIYLLEDIAVTRGATFGDPTTLPVSRAMAESMVENIALYHGRFWQSPKLEQPWLKTSLQFQENADATIDFEKRSLVGIDRSADFVPSEFLRRRDEFYPRLMDSLRLNVAGPHTLLHSDMHLGNWYRLEGDRMGLYDWQCATRGEWALDIAYALLSGLSIEDRRAWEGDLIRHYLDHLAQHGGPVITFDAAWLKYRQQTFHALVFWLYTIGAGRMQPAMQMQHISEENVRRMTQAAVDLGSFDAF